MLVSKQIPFLFVCFEGVKLDDGVCTSKDAIAVSIGTVSFVLCLVQMMFIRLGAPAGVVCGQ